MIGVARLRRLASGLARRGRLRLPAGPPLDGRATGESRATLDDVHACYRLFLQRNPDPIGMGAYADQVARGITVRELISYFVGSPEWIERGLYRPVARSDQCLTIVRGRLAPLPVVTPSRPPRGRRCNAERVSRYASPF